MIKFIDTAAEFHQLAKRGNLHGIGLRRDILGALASAAVGPTGPVPFVVSSTAVDRAGDRITDWTPEGLQIYRKNPVVLWAHRSDQPPIGRALDVKFANGKLTCSIEFVDAATYAFAAEIGAMVRAKYLRAASVGFQVVKATPASDPARRGGYDLVASLLEISIVGVGENPEALALDASGKAAAPARSPHLGDDVTDRVARRAHARELRWQIDRMLEQR